MADQTRTHFNLTQERMAWWLKLDRGTLAQVERLRRALPPGRTLQTLRLDIAAMGQVFSGPGLAPVPAPPSLPLPPLLPQPLARRLAYCRHHAARLRRELAALRKEATGYEARFAALPGLRAWTGPVLDADEEAEWLALLPAGV